jgi:hypothetical protein
VRCSIKSERACASHLKIEHKKHLYETLKRKRATRTADTKPQTCHAHNFKLKTLKIKIMKTTVIGSDKAKNNNEVKTTNRPSLTGKEAKNEAVNDKANADAPQGEENKNTETAEVKDGSTATVDNQPADLAAPKAEEVNPGEGTQAQVEPSKKEIKEQVKAMPIFNLDTTVKLVSELSKKITQRDKLRATIDNLDTFTIASNEDGDVTGSNKFYRCELVLHDDAGNEFVTKNAYIIDHVTQYVNSLCVEKLAEIEAEIVIPA